MDDGDCNRCVNELQRLSELEEIIVYKHSEHNPARQKALRKTWEARWVLSHREWLGWLVVETGLSW